jgi:transcriptional regulator with XRE-family HTH domain
MGYAFGIRLKNWRVAKGISIYAIAKATGISASNLVSIEKGRRPASDIVLQKLTQLEALSINYETLKGWQALDEYSAEAILAALKSLYPDPKDLHSIISDVLKEAES